ncbi:Proprotein convertase P-domain-containing protein [Actinokineospora terrae]|uniref:Proprotein convertase P-domain-containing protein n=2 Tax=Actinokineospora terrae TaxID=155974 RepID=A0A1H9V845_9PSEU|nr:Proprotein convertase P-domain-containing protein [Actinokineospora terrae]
MRSSDRSKLSTRATTGLTAGVSALALVVGMTTPASGQALPANQLTAAQENAARQISALQKVKQTQSKAESKLDSKLAVENRLRKDRSLVSAAPRLQSGVTLSVSDTVLVDISVEKVTDDLVAALTKSGAGIRAVSTGLGEIRAEVPFAALTGISGRADVRKVETASGAITASARPRGTAPAKTETKEQKEARLAAQVQAALEQRGTAALVTSEGDRAHKADTARAEFGVTGVGVKICALSDGVDSLAVSQAAGELPAVDVLPTQEGEGDEGTAMLEILHDLAPGAALGFASAFNSEASFADNIRALRQQLRCDIIVDDVLYFVESPFQDGLIARAVNDVTADGALYFSSAGNEGNTADGTAGHWEGDFRDSGRIVGKFAGTAHDWDPSATTQVFQPISNASSAQVPVTLHWSDPLGASANDYDLYLFDRTGNVVTFSQDVQDGEQDPYEILQTPTFGGNGLRLAVVKFYGENRYLSLSALRGRFADSADGLKAFNTPGVTVGHSAAKQAFSVAAAPAAGPLPFDLEPGDPANPRGPFPGSFSASSALERFSSDGPRRVFYKADGTPITPGNVSGTGGEVRAKPDITAADGVLTSVDGFDPFFGTSAAAPHAAAIAGLVLSGNPGIAPAEVREALVNTAIDLGPAGFDGRTGAGIVLADRVLAYTGASPQPRALAQNPTTAPTDGGDLVDPGDTVSVTLPVRNTGDADAVSTSVVLTSPTAGVTIAPRSQNYGTVPKGQTVSKAYTVTVPLSHPVGTPVVLDARVTFAASSSPTRATFSFSVGRPSPVTRDFAYGGAPVAVPDNNPLGASVTIPVTGVGRASKVSFSVDGATCSTATGATTVGLDHTFVGDLVGTLTAPNGAVATLHSRSGGGGNNLCQVVFADSATAAFSSVTSANAPFTGTWRPTSPLSGFASLVADGAWTYKVVDLAGGDTGSIRAVSLHINGYATPGA